jgi:hypothetical protein
VQGDSLLETFWELDCSILASLFYYIFENLALFDRVTQHTMIRVEVSFFSLSYVFGQFAGWKRQPILYGMFKDLCCLVFSKEVGLAPFGSERHHGGWVRELSLSPVIFTYYNNAIFTAIRNPLLSGFGARTTSYFWECL